MKILSYLSMVSGIVCIILAVVAHYFFEGRLIFMSRTFISGASLSFLASIVFALHHIIKIKSK